MGFLNLFKPAAPSVPPPGPVPAQLPEIKASTAAEICRQFEPSPAAQALLAPGQSPSQYLSVLQGCQIGDEMVKTLAHGLPDRDGVWWAAQSAQRVSAHLLPDDLAALQAALAWVKNPSPENGAATKTALAQTDHRGPGAWAAQAAVWAQAPASPTPGPGQLPRLTPQAVAGAVLLSSAIAANPQLAAPKLLPPPVTAPPMPGTNFNIPDWKAAPAGVPGINAPNLAAPNMPGVPGMPNVPGLTAPGMPLPPVGAPSLPTAQIPGMPGMSAPNLSAPALPGASLAAPNLSAPGLSEALPSAPGMPLPQVPGAALATPNVSAPALNPPPVPTIPPAVKAKTFGDQYPFIALGLEIASGKNRWS